MRAVVLHDTILMGRQERAGSILDLPDDYALAYARAGLVEVDTPEPVKKPRTRRSKADDDDDELAET
ncbi:hypothetical protein [Castellaniella sp.]|uniref:DUF7302 family protein n=1 Tax=Castellaniella sp. TaxID=1955812 RepID=UPI002AFEDEA6|nr:hypothetical protein [Castellaniella sp.]